MRKCKKGFTVVELVITIALVGILSATAAITVSALVNIQSNISKTTSTQKDIEDASNNIKDAVSFVSVKNSICAFEIKACVESEITFTNTVDSADYSLSFAEKTLRFTSDYAGENEYLQYAFSNAYSTLKTIEFSYDASLHLLKATITPESGSTTNHVYPLEVLR